MRVCWKIGLALLTMSCVSTQQTGHPLSEPGKDCIEEFYRSTASIARDDAEALIGRGDYAIIAAGRNPSRPADLSLSEGQICARYEKLESELREQGLAFWSQKGVYRGGEEVSYLVAADPSVRPALIGLAVDLGQESLILAGGGEQVLTHVSGPDAGKAYRGRGWQKLSKPKGDHSALPLASGETLYYRLVFDFDHLQDHPETKKVLSSNLMKP